MKKLIMTIAIATLMAVPAMAQIFLDDEDLSPSAKASSCSQVSPAPTSSENARKRIEPLAFLRAKQHEMRRRVQHALSSLFY